MWNNIWSSGTPQKSRFYLAECFAIYAKPARLLWPFCCHLRGIQSFWGRKELLCGGEWMAFRGHAVYRICLRAWPLTHTHTFVCELMSRGYSLRGWVHRSAPAPLILQCAEYVSMSTCAQSFAWCQQDCYCFFIIFVCTVFILLFSQLSSLVFPHLQVMSVLNVL